MKKNSINPKGSSQPSAEPDKILDQLEEMWDRQIMKGDDELLEQRDSSRPVQKTNAKAISHEEPKQDRRRRKRMI